MPFAEANRIPASGPKGRLLKGDVLAYLGRISSAYPSTQSARISRLGHLDLSNVKPAQSTQMLIQQSSKPRSQEKQVPGPPDREMEASISLSSVLLVQKRIQTVLGVNLPLSTFITRATKLANKDLPRSSSEKSSSEKLFDDVLGLNQIQLSPSEGKYIPQVSVRQPRIFKESMRLLKEPDIYEILSGESPLRNSKQPDVPPSHIPPEPGMTEAGKIFSISVTAGEEKRAKVFLERFKSILQVEPGRLVL